MIVDGDKGARARFIFAHGAGAPMDSEFMNAFATALASHSIQVVRFEFPYMAQRRTHGVKRPPNKIGELTDYWQHLLATSLENLDQAQATLPTFIGGKSMGGRVATLLGQQSHHLPIAGVVCLGYPFHPVGKPEKTRVDHLQDFPLPCLIIQGERDRFGCHDEVLAYPLDKRIQLNWLSLSDHDFKPLKRSGYSQQDQIEQAALWTAQFIRGEL